MTYTHLTTNELVMIEAYYQEGKKVCTIAKSESSIMKLATSPCLKIFVLLSFSKPVISFDNRLETVRLSSQG